MLSRGCGIVLYYGFMRESGKFLQATLLPAALISIDLVMLGVLLALGWVEYDAAGNIIDSKPWGLLLAGVLLATLELAAYRFLVKTFAAREVTELAPKFAWCEVGVGAVLGALCVSLPILWQWAMGIRTLNTAGVASGIGLGIAIGLLTSVFEELFFRGVMFRLLYETRGAVWAFVLTTITFGVMHLPNPGMTLVEAAILGLEGGILFGAAYLWRRRLWLPIGLHFGWNTALGSLLGTNVSDMGEHSGPLNGAFSGSAWLTGASADLKGSLLSLAVTLGLATILMRTRTRPAPATSAASPGSADDTVR